MVNMKLRLNLLPESENLLAPLSSRHKKRQRVVNTMLVTTAFTVIWNAVTSPSFDYGIAAYCHLLVYMAMLIQVWIYDWKEQTFDQLCAGVESMWTDLNVGQALVKRVSKHCRIQHFVLCFPIVAAVVVFILDFLKYFGYLLYYNRLPTPDERVQQLHCSLPFVDVNVSPFYEVTYVFAFLTVCALCWKMSGINSLVLGLINHITAMFHSIAKVLDEIKNPGYLSSSTGVENLRKLKTCVQNHLKLLRFAKQLQNSVKLLLLTLFTFSSIILGLGLIEVYVNLSSHTLRLNGLAISIFMTTTMFFYSWKSQQLTNAANELSFAYYNTPWYNESLEFQKIVLSAMQSLEKPISLSVFFYQLNNEEFGQLMRKAASYFTIFNTLMQNKS